jgi:hypothetical protein
LTQVCTISCVLCPWVDSPNNSGPQRINGHSLLHKSVEKFTSRPRSPAIETKSEFVQVIVQVRYSNSPLMGSQQPAFKQGDNPIDQWQKILADVGISSGNLMDIAKSFQRCISTPVIRTYNAAWLNILLDRTSQTFRRGIGYSTKTDSSNPIPVLLSRYDHKRLACSAPTTLASLFSTDIKFIHLHSPRETVSPWPYHSKTQLVQPNPSGPVTAQAQYSLNIKCAYSVFLIRYIPHRAEPQLQRFSRILKNRPCGHRGLKITFPAMIQSPFCLPCLLMATTGANKPLWPAMLEKILLACLLRGKSVFKFQECSRVIFHTRKYYMLGSLESSA